MCSRTLLTFLLATVIAGCGGVEFPPPPEISQANFVYGVVVGAECGFFELDEDGEPGALPDYEASTSSDGSVSFGRFDYVGTAIIECEGGTYIDEATGNERTGPLTRAVVNVEDGGVFTVSPLTEIAYQLAEREVLAETGGWDTAVTTYNPQVASTFGLDVDITTTTPEDIGLLEDGVTLADDAAGQYATVLAIISQVDANTADDYITEYVELLDTAGELDEATILELSAAVEDLGTSAVAAALNGGVLTAVATQAGAVNNSGVVEISGDPAVDTELTATVTDDDGFAGDITYQWFSEGEEIEGETSNTLAVDESLIGRQITVTASYLDNAGFNEGLTSEQVVSNFAGSLTIEGTSEVGVELSAVLIDVNGTGDNLPYQWLLDGVAVEGATSATFTPNVGQLGGVPSVTLMYTDNDGYEEDLIAVTSAVAGSSVNLLGSFDDSIGGQDGADGFLRIGDTLTAPTISDDNVISGPITYTWRVGDANGAAIGTDSNSIDLPAEAGGSRVYLEASYTDDSGYFGELDTTTTAIVVSDVVDNKTDLLTAVDMANSQGYGYILLEEGDFSGPLELLLEGNVSLGAEIGNSPVLSGAICIDIGADTSGILIDGLQFEDLTTTIGQACHDYDVGETNSTSASFIVRGDSHVVSNNSFLSDVATRDAADFDDGDVYNYMFVEGTNHLIERNEFSGKYVEDLSNAGTAIQLTVDGTADQNEGTTIQYNLFQDFVTPVDPAIPSAAARAIQLGTDAAADHTYIGNHAVLANRFDSLTFGTQVIAVQGSENTIAGNTFEAVLGRIALLNGYNNTVNNNAIFGNILENGWFGISFLPLGHQVTDNYAFQHRRTIQITAAAELDEGNQAVIAAAAGLDLTTLIARNTVFGSRDPLEFQACGDFVPTLNFDSNLIYSPNGMDIWQSANRTIVEDSAWDGICSATMSFTDNHFYGQAERVSGMGDPQAGLSTSRNFSIDEGNNGNIFGFTDDGAPDGGDVTTISDAEAVDIELNILAQGFNADAGIGVDITTLTVLEDEDVGPGTTTTHVLDD